jgi:tryptophan synthase alpha chain
VALLKDRDIDQIFLLAPNSDAERVDLMDQVGSGYLYYVSLKGVTGAGHLDTDDVEQKLAMIKQHTQLPVGVGFGVKDAKTAKTLASIADGVVVGSALIAKIEANLDNPEQARSEIIELLTSMRQAMDS